MPPEEVDLRKQLQHIVLMNGYSLAENPALSDVKDQDGKPVVGNFGDWDHVCIGKPSERLGRIPTAMYLAGTLRATCLIWSTGDTWLPGSVSEAKWSYEAGINFLRSQKDMALIPLIERISVFDAMSINTATTMYATLKFLRGRFYGESMMLHLVSSANHLPRVMRDAAKVFGAERDILLSGVPTGTSYGGKTPGDVVVYDLGQPPKRAV